MTIFYGISILIAAIAFAFAAYLYVWVKKQPQENAKITVISLVASLLASLFVAFNLFG